MAQGRPRELEFVARLCYFGKPLKCYFNTNGFIGKRREMSTQILPAASLRSTNRLPAARAWVEGSNHLIWMAGPSPGKTTENRLLRIPDEFSVQEFPRTALRNAGPGLLDVQPQSPSPAPRERVPSGSEAGEGIR